MFLFCVEVGVLVLRGRNERGVIRGAAKGGREDWGVCTHLDGDDGQKGANLDREGSTGNGELDEVFVLLALDGAEGDVHGSAHPGRQLDWLWEFHAEVLGGWELVLDFQRLGADVLHQQGADVLAAGFPPAPLQALRAVDAPHLGALVARGRELRLHGLVHASAPHRHRSPSPHVFFWRKREKLDWLFAPSNPAHPFS